MILTFACFPSAAALNVKSIKEREKMLHVLFHFICIKILKVLFVHIYRYFVVFALWVLPLDFLKEVARETGQ